MLYIDYKFEITDEGIYFIDADGEWEKNQVLKMPKGYQLGDKFELTSTPSGNIFLKRCK